MITLYLCYCVAKNWQTKGAKESKQKEHEWYVQRERVGFRGELNEDY